MTGKNTKFWRAQDGLRIPHHTSPERTAWDEAYRQKLVTFFGNGDANRLKPIRIPVSEHLSGHFVQGAVGAGGRDRRSFYSRMVAGGDRLPPIIVRRNGIGWHVVDGNARLTAALKHKLPEMEAYELVDPPAAAPPKKLKKDEETLEKGLLTAMGLSAALATGGAMQQHPNAPQPQIEQQAPAPEAWTPEGLSAELYPMAHLESSWGKNMAHAAHPKGEFHTAFGAVGLKPLTAHEEYTKSPELQSRYPGLSDPEDFTTVFKNNPKFYNHVASTHFNRLKRLLGDVHKAVYAWRWGQTAAHNAKPEQIDNDAYVQKYKDMMLDQSMGRSLKPAVAPVVKAEEFDLQKMAIADIRPQTKTGLRPFRNKPIALEGGMELQPGDVYDYTEHLDPSHRLSGLSLIVHEPKHTFEGQPVIGLHAMVLQGRTPLGHVVGSISRSPGQVLKIGLSELPKELRGRGLGQKLYEALYAHAYHRHGIRTVAGTEHSTMASKLHNRLSEIHGLDYKPHLEVPPEDRPTPRSDEQPGAFDARYQGYQYALKSEDTVSEILPHLTDDLRRSPWKGAQNCLAGHCYVASEVLFHLLGGPTSGWVPQSIQHEGGPHWYLKHKETGQVLDPTASQFQTPVPYNKGVGKGFLTKQPSKRAQQVINAVLARRKTK